jgi:hypothetical protein
VSEWKEIIKNFVAIDGHYNKTLISIFFFISYMFNVVINKTVDCFNELDEHTEPLPRNPISHFLPCNLCSELEILNAEDYWALCDISAQNRKSLLQIPAKHTHSIQNQ